MDRIKDPNFAFLSGEDEYARYFNLLNLVFDRVLKSYQGRSADSHEANSVADFLKRLRFDIEALRVKWTYNSETRPLWVDLTDSGFPNFMEIDSLKTDLASKPDRLKMLMPESLLKAQILDRLLEDGTDSPEVLKQLSERAYLEMIETEKLFLPFTPGTLAPMGQKNDQRNYVFSWGCYDFATSRPYIHLMAFDQDADQQPLEEGGDRFREMMGVVRAEGSRAPDVKILALAIDDALEPIHPKIIKRICIGPLYARSLLQNKEIDGENVQQIIFRDLLENCAREDDFVLMISDEIIFSREQSITKRLLSSKSRVREIFAIPEEDPRCFSRGASVVHNNLLMPHNFLQNAGRKIELMQLDLGKYSVTTYDAKGRVRNHGRIKP